MSAGSWRCTGTELLTLDPHGLYLPGRQESVCANLYDAGSSYYFDAHESWPGTVAPFEALAAACPGTVPALGLGPPPQGSCPGASSARSVAPGAGGAPGGFPGPLFRLPLRTEATAARSEVCKQPLSCERVQALLEDFAAAAPQMLVFTRHVREITVLLVEPDSSEATLLAHFTAAQRALLAEPGDGGAAASQLTVRGAISGALEGATPQQVDQQWLKVEVRSADNATELSEVASLLGASEASGTSGSPPELDGNLYCCMPVRIARRNTNIFVRVDSAARQSKVKGFRL